MTVLSRSLRTKLLIGASIGSMLLSGVAEAQDRSGGRVFSGRGGGGDPAAAAARAAQSQAQRQAETNSASRRAIETFRRAAETRQSMHDAQAVARAAARAIQSNIPNGLGQGGLQVANGVELDPSLWVGANGPVQGEGENGRTNVSIEQTQQRAILTWDSFNVGRETDLVFNQGGADWVALNRVTGNSADPSRILGSIKADGSVYIINQNGIIFGGASQINVRNLVASTANISNTQFLENGIYSNATGSGAAMRYLPSFTGAGGAVTVEAGAQIATNMPSSVTSGGGYVLLMGTEVTNAGTITTPRGQAALSAGDDFIIRRGYGTEENPYSTTRGNEVRGLINASSASGAVTNAGLIEAAQGDITLAGRTIRQEGVMVSTTGVHQRGTIHLLNSASDGEGSVTLGADSLTIILPELDSEDTALNGQRDALIAESNTANASRQNTILGGFDDRSTIADRLDQSRIEIVTGGDVVFEGGSQTIAQGGQVAVQANNGRITVEDGARIDVSGVMGVALDMESNAIQVNVQGNELRDSAPNRDADYLKNQNVWIDVRDLILLPDGTGGYEGDRWYTPGGLLEVGGYLQNMAHGIGEWAAVGGTITLAASEVVAQQGAIFDISGGSLDYQSGYVRSTQVMGADGRMYDIRNAPAHMQFVSVGSAFIRRHERWGEMYTKVYADRLFSRGTSTRWEQGYTVGRDAGRLILSAPTVIMEGDILAEVINGERQINARAHGIADGYKLGQHTVAQAGALVLGRYGLTAGQAGLSLHDVDVRIGEIADLTGETATGEALPADRIGTAWFDATRLNEAGLGGIELKTRGAIAIESDITLVDGGRVDLVSHTIDIGADITARSGRVSATNQFSGGVDQGAALNLFDGGGRSSVTLQEGATLDLRGVWTNAFDEPSSAAGLAHRDGGMVRFSAANVTLEEGSTIDVSSGAGLLTDGSLLGGRGGDVTLLSDSLFGSTGAAQGTGELTLDGEIIAHGVDGGGTLTIEAGQSVVIGGQITGGDGVLEAGAISGGSLVLAEDLVIEAGEVLPIDVQQVINRVNAGEVLPAGVQFTNVTGLNIVVGPDGWDLTGTNLDLYVGTTRYRGTVNPRIVPAGSIITRIASGSLPAGYEIAAGSLPQGLPIPAMEVTIPAGTVATIGRTIAAGTVLPGGTRLDRTVAVRPTLGIDPALFRSGFSNYAVNGLKGLTVAEGASVDIIVPVLRQSQGALAVRSGSDPMAALELWTPPLHLEDPQSGRLIQRAGANLELVAGRALLPGDTIWPNVDLTIGRGASVTVDAGHMIDLAGMGQITVDGALVAPGGTIRARSLMTNEDLIPILNGHGRSIWIGESAVLDVAGRAYTAVDAQGRRYGQVLKGGNILLSGALNEATGQAEASHLFVVVRDGALLDASGAVATLDVPGRGATQVASDGGMISFASFNGLDLGGTWLAHGGGTGASGGTLSVALEAASYLARAANRVVQSRDLVIGQVRQTSALDADATPGSAAQSLQYGAGHIGVDQIEAGGFDAVNLLSHGILAFDGDVSLSVGRSLQLYSAALALAETSQDDAVIELTAPYVRLAGIGSRARDGQRVYPVLNLGQGSRHSERPTQAQFAVAAEHIDVQRNVLFGVSGSAGSFSVDRRGFDNVELISSGDMRFPTSGSGTLLQTRGDLVLGARQIYPGTGAGALIRAGWHVVSGGLTDLDPDRSLTILSTGDAPDTPPYSAFGNLTFVAATINQGGVIKAPLGRITLGTSARADDASKITFLPGSITSTSAKGLIMPYGGTVDGIDWFYAGSRTTLQGAVSPNRGVFVDGVAVDVQQGAVIDVSGGGDLTGAGFVSGRGGSIDTLRHPLIEANPGYGMSASGNGVYAIVPGYASAYAPIDPDAGAGEPMIGQQITLDGNIPGLPAGTYTLMPSTYALLPGAFRVELPAAADPRGAAASGSFPDGSYFASVRLGIANTSIQDTLARQAIVTPANVARSYSLYNEMNYAEFALADAARIGVPRAMTPLDAQMFGITLAPGAGAGAFRFQGAIDFSAGEGGYAGSAALRARSGGFRDLEILAAGAAPDESYTGVSVYAADLNALSASRLVVGAFPEISYGRSGRTFGYQTGNAAVGSIILREGAVLRAAEVLLVNPS